MSQKKILIVDDELDLVVVVRYRLESEGFVVIAANDGETAIEKVKSESPDLILLDVMMPGIDGYEVCKRLKSDDKYKDIPIIMLTAKVQKLDRETGLKLGANDYIAKPFDTADLLEKIQANLKD